MRFRLLWIGKEGRRDPETELAERYLQRLQPFIKTEMKVLKAKQAKSLSDDEIRDREAKSVVAELDRTDFLVLCDERGKLLSSPQLADHLTTWQERAVPRVVFLIGGSLGVSQEIRTRADFMLSFSKMTLPHALARVLLLEQLYRACCIQAGHPYHHEG